MNRSRLLQMLARGGFRALRSGERLVRGKLTSSPDALAKTRRFLFMEYERALGSNVHTTPVFEALKMAVPACTIAVACRGIGFEVFKHNPYVDDLIETPDPYTQPLRTARYLRRHLRQSSFEPEVILTSTGNRRRSITLIALLVARALRIGYNGAPELYHSSLVLDAEQSLIANNLRLIPALGYSVPAVEPRVAFSQKDLDKARKLLGLSSSVSDGPRVVFITQTSPTQCKSWPVDRFVSVIDHVMSKHNAEAIFVGTSAESAAIDLIRVKVNGDTISLAGKTTIPELAALLSMSDFAATLDTGNMHIARSVGLPMVILAPAWQPVIEWLPLGFDQYRIFKGDDIPVAPPGYQILEVQAAEVIEALDDLLAKYPPSAAARRRRIEHCLSAVRA